MAKITIMTVGSRGDVQPYIALGLGLQSAGYHVEIATNENFGDFVRGFGLDYFPLTGDAQAIVEGELGRAAIDSGANFLKLARKFRETLDSVIEPFLADCIAACAESDAVVHGLLGFFGQQIAEKRGIPSIGAFLQPATRTQAFPNIAMPVKHLGGWGNYMTHVAGEQVYWQAFRPIINRWRREQLGLPTISALRGPFGDFITQRYPIVYGYSPTVMPKPADWGDFLHVTGYWQLDQSADYTPPDDLATFLAAGDKPIYIGFGSMSNRDPAATTELILEAVQQAGVRAILLTGWGGLDTASLPDSVFAIASVPHSWLFPQVAGVVHHCGMGTTAAGFRAGVPTIGVPFFGDQFFWGRRAQELGVGTAPITRKRLAAEKLSAAIREAVDSRPMQTAAQQLSQQLAREDGVARAVEIISQHVTR